MIDLSGFPSPEGAPEPGSCVRVERPREGLVVVTLDPPHRSLAVLDAPLLRDLSAAVDEIERDSSIRGVVFTGRNAEQFAAGADVEAIGNLTDPVIVERVVLAVHALFRQIQKLKPRTVAAVGGPVPGGAYELSLSCDRIVATDDSKTRLGLPETLLGIIPGWGGSHRLPRRIGVVKSLDAILAGKLIPAKKAKRLGMIDRTTKAEYLTEVASDIAMGDKPCPRAKRSWTTKWLVDRNPIAMAVIKRQALKQVMSRTGGHYPAPLVALDLVTESPGTSLEEGARKEAKAIVELATGSICKNLVQIFFASEAAKKLGKPKDGEKLTPITHGGVIGAGVMGAGIASAMAQRGVSTRLVDLSADALDRAQLAHRAAVEKKRKRRRMEPHAADAAIDNLDVAREIIGFQRAGIVVEAVAETIGVKQKVLGAAAEQVSDDAILATNTSSLSVDAIAKGLPHPERICGMHFFNPVSKMPLVEVIRGSATSDSVVTAVCALALRMGKTPVVVRDVSGFLVNRVLGPYLDEAVRLFQEGADPVRVDAALEAFGMPMGPFRLLDEVGLDIATHAAASLHEAYGDRMQPATGLEAFESQGRVGKKSGTGFYRHPAEGTKGKPSIMDDLSRYQSGSAAKNLTDAEIVDRLVLAMLNEGARCLEESVVDSARELDLATVFGTGFAPFRGGLLRYADSLGAPEVIKRLESIGTAADVSNRGEGTQRFEPAAILHDLAKRDAAFHDRGAQDSEARSAS